MTQNKSELKIPPESYFFRVEYGNEIQFRTNIGEWMPIKLNLTPHGKRLIATCACWEWHKYDEQVCTLPVSEGKLIESLFVDKQIKLWSEYGGLQ